MTPNSSRTRHILYVVAAVLTAAMAGIDNLDVGDGKQIAAYLISVAAAGVIASRAYIDQSPATVVQPIETKNTDEKE